MADGGGISSLITLLGLLWTFSVYGGTLMVTITPLELARTEGAASRLLGSFKFSTENFVSLKQLFAPNDYGFRHLYNSIVEPLDRVVQLIKVSRHPSLQKLLLGPRKLQNNPALRRLFLGLPRKQLTAFRGNLFTVVEALTTVEGEEVVSTDWNDRTTAINLLQQEERFVIYPNMVASISFNLLRVLMSDEHIVHMKNLNWITPLRTILISPKSMSNDGLARNMLVPVLAEIISESEDTTSLPSLLSAYLEAGSPTAAVKVIRLLVTELAISSYQRRMVHKSICKVKVEILQRLQEEVLNPLWPTGSVSTLKQYLRSNDLIPSERSAVLDLTFAYIDRLAKEATARTIGFSMMILSLSMHLPLNEQPHYVNRIIRDLSPNRAVPLLTVPFLQRYQALIDNPLHLGRFRNVLLPRRLRSLKYKRRRFIAEAPFVRSSGLIIGADQVKELWHPSTCDALPIDVQVRRDATNDQLVYLDAHLIDLLASSLSHGERGLENFYGKEVQLKSLICTWPYMILHKRSLPMGFIFLAGQEKSASSWNDWVLRMTPEQYPLTSLLHSMLDQLKIYKHFTINELRGLVDSDFVAALPRSPVSRK